LKEIYVLILNGKYYNEDEHGFTANSEDKATKYESSVVYKKKSKLQKKAFGNISVKIVK